MLKRMLAIIMVVCLLPVMVYAATWSVSTWVKTLGGSLQAEGYPVQTSANGRTFKAYTSSGIKTVTITPNSGYMATKVEYNGVVLIDPVETSFAVSGPLAQSVYVTFAQLKYSISASVAGGVGGSSSVQVGLVNVAAGTALISDQKVTFTPSASYRLDSISGIPAGAVQSPAVPVANQPVIVTFPAGYVVNSNAMLVGTFVTDGPIAKAGSGQSVVAGATVTLDGSSSVGGGTGISSYSWAQVSGPAAVTLTNASSAIASFTPTVAGTYSFSLTLMPGGSTATTQVEVFSDPNLLVVNLCQNCHVASGNAPTINAYTKWNGTKHELNNVVCSTCHVGSDTGTHPGIVPENKCISCHTNNLGTSPSISVGHMGIVDTFKTTCYECHKHDLVAVSPILTCTDCHGNPPSTQLIHTTGFAKYSHVSNICADCHNAPPTTDPTPTHRNGAVEVLTNANACSSCHSYPPATNAHTGAVAGSTPNCATCHVYNYFTDATHNNGTTNFTNQACTACHGHPPTVFTLAVSGKTGPHPVSEDCAMCHGYVPADVSATGLHRNGILNVLTAGAPPHFNNSTSAGYSASYVTSKVTSCAFCHNGNLNNQTIRQEWATSGHANTEAAPAKATDFKVYSPCVRCHTTTGFIAYSSANMITQWGLATDKTKEVITCVACHSDVANGTVRTVTPNKPYESDQTFTNANVGSSNVCMDCHGGRNNGSYIQSQVGTTDFTNYPFQYKTHYMVSGGILQGMSGFNFPGRTYSMFSENSHSKIGMSSMGTGTSGPCAGCHMSSPTKHKFSVATEVSGTITAIETNVCANCHNTSLPAATLNAKRIAFNNALEILRIQLADKGYFWDATVKTFYRDVPNAIVATNWGVGQNGANVMGAAMNYKMFITEPSAYAHNPAYAKELITDSIDAAFNGGVVTGSIDTALADLQTKGKITAGQISAINAYKQVDASCNSCHGNPPATTTHNGIAAGTCTNCHIFTGAGGATHNNGIVDLQSGTAACSSCHGFPPATQTVHTTGFVQYNHDKVGIVYASCSQCHSEPASPSPTATHINGTVDLLTNATSCSSCHSAPPASSVHSAATLTPFNCTDCHSYTTSSATTHNNGTIDFSNLQCNTCHGYPPMSQTQLDSRVAGTFTTAKLEDYANGGGHHATHLPPSLTANEAFTPCLPCHPNATSGFHSQGGGTIVKANVNVFEAADMGYRFDETRAKRYEVATQSCSNVSCHFQPTVSW
ncbi:MAG: hypothetical protein PHF56_18070 [Desulfuromonadaceae bacterium]|nr:hypothetical protein [Desulfuromonadaceae bacterium]